MQKFIFWSLISIGSGVGGWIPTLWHASMFSIWGVIGGLAGTFGGWWVARSIDAYINI